MIAHQEITAPEKKLKAGRVPFALGVADAQIVLSVGEILLGSFAKPFYRLHLILCQATFAQEECRPESFLGFGIAHFRSSADFGHQLAVRLVLLSGQLKDSGTQQEQKREHQPILFHIGRLAWFSVEITDIHPLTLYSPTVTLASLRLRRINSDGPDQPSCHYRLFTDQLIRGELS